MQYIKILQIVIAILLMLSILLQNRGGGLSGVFGGDNVYLTKRGFDKKIFVATIVLSVAFFALALLGISL